MHTGYNLNEISNLSTSDVVIDYFFMEAPNLNSNRILITGSICGVKVQEVEDPIMREIRYLDKLIDKIAKEKSMDKILRK